MRFFLLITKYIADNIAEPSKAAYKIGEVLSPVFVFVDEFALEVDDELLVEPVDEEDVVASCTTE